VVKSLSGNSVLKYKRNNEVHKMQKKGGELILALVIYFLRQEDLKNLNLPEEALDTLIELDEKKYGIIVCGSSDGTYPDLEEILRLFYPKSRAREVASKIEEKAIKTVLW